MQAWDQTIDANMTNLKENPYPGRGIVLGMAPDGKRLVQVYWIMGRSENSRNRVFEIQRDGSVRTKAFNESKLKDPSLVIYCVARDFEKSHIVTNGDHTDTIYEHLSAGAFFEAALRTREYEPDPPNYTPRISGMTNLGGAAPVYQLSILKTVGGNPDCSAREFFEYSKAIPGVGHCIHTYQGDGDPLPSFAGEPYMVRMLDSIEETAKFYWSHLNEENRVSLLVKFINPVSGEADMRVVNKHLGD